MVALTFIESIYRIGYNALEFDFPTRLTTLQPHVLRA